MATETRISPAQQSTVAMMQATETGITPQTTTMNMFLTTLVLSMVMATEDTSRVAFTPLKGSTTVGVESY